MSWGIYIHVPFCVQKCSYCDFYSYRGKEQEKESLAQAVALHLSMANTPSRVKPNRPPTSIFFGGGTPSLLSAESLRLITNVVKETYGPLEQMEVTLEANPGTLTLGDAEQWLDLGINRLSIGAQAFQPRLLQLLGRIHSPRQILEAVKLAKGAGFNNISLDLMYGIPGQNLQEWMTSLELAVDSGVSHISMYNLKVEPGTMFHSWVARGLLSDEDEEQEELSCNMYWDALKYLCSKGFAQYELSNLARQGSQCRHNHLYWARQNYLGYGPGATSSWGNTRWTWVRNAEQYCSEVQKMHASWNSKSCVSLESQRDMTDEWEEIDGLTALGEAVFLGLRRVEGINMEELSKNTDSKTAASLKDKAGRLERMGMLIGPWPRLKLHPRGYLISNEIMAQLLP